MTKSLRLMSSKKKTSNATPRTGLRTGRKGKLELDQTTTSTPAPEDGKQEKEDQSESGKKIIAGKDSKVRFPLLKILVIAVDIWL